MKLQKIIGAFIAAVLITGAAAAGGMTAFAAEIPQGYEKLGETNTLRLYYNKTINAVSVEDKRNGFIWSSNVTKDYYREKIDSVPLENGLNSMFIFQYSDYLTNHNQINSGLVQSKRSYRPIENGICVSFYFEKVSIGFDIEMWIENDAFQVKVPHQSIREDGKYGMISIEMMPLFGAARPDEEGYMFYPDGSGALMYYRDINETNDGKIRLDVYSDQQIDIDKMEDDDKNGIQYAMLPVFGAKRAQNAFIGIITSGDTDSTIDMALEGMMYNLNRIYPEFRYRNRYVFENADKQSITAIDKRMIRQDYCVKYVLLAGAQSNYSGMANAYRGYLLDNHLINQAIHAGDAIPLGIDLFMGATEEGMLFKKFISMTTFEEAKVILEAFQKQGVASIQTALIGWSKKGYGAFSEHWPVAGKLGGKNGLKDFLKYTGDQNIQTFLLDNYVNANASDTGFSKRNDVLYKPNGLIITNGDKNQYLLSPQKLFNKFKQKILGRYQNLGVQGIAFEQFGRRLFADSQVKELAMRADTVKNWSQFLSTSNQNFGKSASVGGNSYVLPYVSRLYQIPTQDSGYFYTHESVPFYQMVVHGSIPYSTTAGNLHYDQTEQKLQWIEYGAMPYYELTFDNSQELRYTEYNTLFTSRYTDWIQRACDVYAEMNAQLKDVWNCYMTGHEKLRQGVYRVTYSNGTMVYVNYNDEAYVSQEIQVDAQSYTVAK